MRQSGGAAAERWRTALTPRHAITVFHVSSFEWLHYVVFSCVPVLRSAVFSSVGYVWPWARSRQSAVCSRSADSPLFFLVCTIPYCSTTILPTTAVESLKTKGRLRFHSPPPAQRAPLSRHAAISARELLSTVRPHLHLTLHLPCFPRAQLPLAHPTQTYEISLQFTEIISECRRKN